MVVVGFAVIFLVIEMLAGFGVGFWVGKRQGKEEVERKYKPEGEWKKTDVSHFE